MALREEITPARYQAFLEAFLALGPKFSVVAKRVGCSAYIAREAWERGWPDRPDCPAISTVYAKALQRMDKRIEQREKARIAAEPAPPEVTLDAGRPVIRISEPSGPKTLTPSEAIALGQATALSAEMQLLQQFRRNLAGAIGASGRLIPAFETLADSVSENLLVQAQSHGIATPDALLNPLEKFAKIVGMLTASAKGVMEMQRLLVGAPTQIIENRGADPNGPDLQERITRASRVLDIMKRAGMLPGDGGNPDALDASPARDEYEGEQSDTVRSVLEDMRTESQTAAAATDEASQGASAGQNPDDVTAKPSESHE